MGIGWTLRDNDWNKLRQILQRIASLRFGYDATPTFTGLSVTTLSATSISATTLSVSTVSAVSATITQLSVSTLSAVSVTTTAMTVSTLLATSIVATEAVVSTVLSVGGLSTLTGGILIGESGNIEKSTNDLTLTTASQKTLVLSQPVYKDINLGSAALALPVATQPDEAEFTDELGAGTGIYTWGFAVGEKVSGSFEIQHDYKEATDLYFHVHWQGIAALTAATDYVRWKLSYTVSRENETLDAKADIYAETAIDVRYDFKRSDFAAITGTNFQVGDQFLFTIERVAATLGVGPDEYAGDALVATLGVHYQIDTIGSRQISTK
jgi:hypothetical protein